jgi:hypothetical protein
MLDDRAELVGALRGGLSSWNDLGFLVWDPGQPPKHDPPGASDLAALIAGARDHVLAAGTTACSFPAPLEAWYRFLVDPEPTDSMASNGQVGIRGPVNGVVLDQRSAFLRPDATVVIVMSSDGNDCSIVDENSTQGWLVAYAEDDWRMPRAHAVCDTAPNDPACSPCGLGDPDPGCQGGIPRRASSFS